MNGLWHISFTVSDLERSILFYRDLLGLELTHTQEQANAYTSKLVGYEDAHLKVAQFRIPNAPVGHSGHHLELVEYLNPKGLQSDLKTCNPGVAHLAFVVQDALESHTRLKAAGVKFISPPNLIESGINTGGYTCYFRDPDEITLELVQTPISLKLT
jgi:catechol 2,3-dioxygenase-like lactoylglutathione lyase family enzyme